MDLSLYLQLPKEARKKTARTNLHARRRVAGTVVDQTGPKSGSAQLTVSSRSTPTESSIKWPTSTGLYPKAQSAYLEHHSTETALLRVKNDILLNMNQQRVTLLVLLDLSAAFDTVAHTILLDCLSSDFGYQGKPTLGSTPIFTTDFSLSPSTARH